MSLALITYCLPALLGYLLFVGVSGRLDPFSCPRHLPERPSWALGLWIGGAVSMVLLVGLGMAYSRPFEDARVLLAPSAWSLSALLVPGLVAWFVYRDRIARTLEREAGAHRERSSLAARITALPVADDEPLIEPFEETDEEGPGGNPLVATFLGVDGPQKLDIPDIPVARADLEIALDADGLALLAERLVPAPIVVDTVSRAEHEVALGAEDLSGTRCLALRAEEASRGPTEKRLRVVCKALARLESESRSHAGDRTDASTAPGEELESRTRDGSTAGSRATRETARRAERERRVLALERDVLVARRDARRSMTARTRALSVARRAMELSRREVRARARLEADVRELKDELADREATLGSLVRALELEKGRTRQEVDALARKVARDRPFVRSG